ncbi:MULTISPECIES: hypothetical protein [unclassified Janthinobacterium]|uniref:hypothetical protein n=1 Tax=unclassified Janthinobacterium TaxID=2610881 RepID=UPI0012F8AF47|nr:MULTISPECIES: hypothetical protein [unclassified Janthinobacterium]MEC5162750.1 hypothetical protein [Janthinobacterium sp. CG_S6]
MPNTNFLCIDDQQDRTIDDLLSLLHKSNKELLVERKTPIELAAQIKQISTASKEKNNFGLLLDLRLDQEATDDHPKVPYRGPTLAQELRTRMTEKKIAPFPIVLWSITEKFVKSFDESSHDLFDAVFGKDDQIIDQPAQVAIQMISLVNGYAQIVSNKKGRLAGAMLGFGQESTVGLHESFVEEFKYFVEGKAVHEISSYLLNSLIGPTGLLIDKTLLAARLGIDIAKSGASWTQLQVELEIARYGGPFCAGWQRWWWFTVEVWWNNLNAKQPNLRRIGAAERIKILNDRFGFALKAATPIEADYSDKFFCICVATGKPLDPADGFRVAELNMKPWQDTAYVSGYAALNRIEKTKWRISSADRGRFDRLKKS